MKFFLASMLLFAQPATALTCSLLNTVKQHEVFGMDQSPLYETVLVELYGMLSKGKFTVNRMSFTDTVMPWCYELRGEWRCGSVPQAQASLMLSGRQREKHASSKFYLDEDGTPTISYTMAWIDNARSPSNQVSIVNDVVYFKGKYQCQ